MPQPKLTPQDAQTFEHHSVAHVARLMAAAEKRGCHCEPYVDWFTYQRWQALGRQVQKGEKATRLGVFRSVTKRDEKTGEEKVIGSRPWTAFVFCRCQTKPKEEEA